jgi:hypothetical protein
MRRITHRSLLFGAVIAAAALAATGGGVAASAKTVITDVEFTGTKSFLLRLKKGSYRSVCDPHSGSMRGGFQIS